MKDEVTQHREFMRAANDLCTLCRHQATCGARGHTALLACLTDDPYRRSQVYRVDWSNAGQGEYEASTSQRGDLRLPRGLLFAFTAPTRRG
ncbi:MAG TPA: hypothetical protein VGW38_03565, partial [Chloroflexota bacterium]|nr:hypothetical protein [Chloroflexota bacterium]